MKFFMFFTRQVCSWPACELNLMTCDIKVIAVPEHKPQSPVHIKPISTPSGSLAFSRAQLSPSSCTHRHIAGTQRQVMRRLSQPRPVSCNQTSPSLTSISLGMSEIGDFGFRGFCFFAYFFFHFSHRFLTLTPLCSRGQYKGSWDLFITFMKKLK